MYIGLTPTLYMFVLIRCHIYTYIYKVFIYVYRANPNPVYVCSDQVPAAEFLGYVGALFFFEVALLAAWTAVAPPFYRHVLMNI